VANELGVAEKSSGTMMVRMEEGEWLLLEEKEAGIEQFQELSEVIKIIEDNQLICPSAVDVANAIKDTVPV